MGSETMKRGETAKERGSLSPLIIGALLIGALLLAVIADSARVFLAHRDLVRLSDSTVLAAARALDVGAYYAGRSTGNMPLDRDRAWQIAQAWIRQSPKSNSQLQDLQISSLIIERGQVTVTLTARISEAFFYGIGRSHFVTLSASAAAFSQRSQGFSLTR